MKFQLAIHITVILFAVIFSLGLIGVRTYRDTLNLEAHSILEGVSTNASNSLENEILDFVKKVQGWSRSSDLLEAVEIEDVENTLASDLEVFSQI